MMNYIIHLLFQFLILLNTHNLITYHSILVLRTINFPIIKFYNITRFDDTFLCFYFLPKFNPQESFYNDISTSFSKLSTITSLASEEVTDYNA